MTGWMNSSSALTDGNLRTWSNAARVARMIGREGNFSFLEGMGVKGGTFVMRLVAGRILKKAEKTATLG